MQPMWSWDGMQTFRYLLQIFRIYFLNSDIFSWGHQRQRPGISGSAGLARAGRRDLTTMQESYQSVAHTLSSSLSYWHYFRWMVTNTTSPWTWLNYTQRRTGAPTVTILRTPICSTLRSERWWRWTAPTSRGLGVNPSQSPHTVKVGIILYTSGSLTKPLGAKYLANTSNLNSLHGKSIY